MKTIRIIILLIIIVILGGLIWYRETKAPTINSSQQKQPQGDIVVESLHSGDSVTSPLTITGKAKGNWFFEASFPVKVEDASGTVLAQGIAKAQGDWMTTDYVPFTATLTFSKPSTKTGRIVFKKDNPSGLPENDAYYIVPVTFTPQTSQQPAGTCAPDLSNCGGNPVLCMETSKASVCN